MEFRESPPPQHSNDTRDGGPVIARGQDAPWDGAPWLPWSRSSARRAGTIPHSELTWLDRKLRPGEGSGLARCLLFYGGVLAPFLFLITGSIFISFGPRATGPPPVDFEPEVHLYHTAEEFFRWPAIFPFVPFLLYSAWACTVTLWEVRDYGRSLWARWGLYTGVILAVQFWFLSGLIFTKAESLLSLDTLVWMPLSLVITLSLLVAVGVIARAIWRKNPKGWLGLDIIEWATVYLLFVLLMLFLTFVCDLPLRDLASLVVSPVLFSFSLLSILTRAAPAWALATYVLLSLYVGSRYGGRQIELWQFFVALLWFAMYFTAWRFAFSWATA